MWMSPLFAYRVSGCTARSLRRRHHQRQRRSAARDTRRPNAGHFELIVQRPTGRAPTSAPQDCGTCPTTTTTTTTTTPPIQCCVQSSPMGAFDICLRETPAQCAAQGGIDHGSGTCSPNPCLPGCFQPGPDCVSCGTCGNGLCAWNGSNTCGTHHGPNPVCINPSDCSGGACSAATGDASCPPGQACVLVGGSGPICCAGCF